MELVWLLYPPLYHHQLHEVYREHLLLLLLLLLDRLDGIRVRCESIHHERHMWLH
jgi:hypothetical protein